MSDDKLIHPPAMESDDAQVPAPQNGAAPPAYADEAYFPPMEPEEEGIDVRRYVFALLRYKWLLALALVLGAGGAYTAWTMTEVSYTTEGSLWIEVEGRRTADDVTPIRTSGILQSNAWIELLRSYQVLDTVAIQERLFLQYPEEYAPTFEHLELPGEFRPGDYKLSVGSTGDDFVLTTSEGALVQQGAFGVPIGRDIGFRWTPARGSFPPDAEVSFSVLTPREAAQSLSQRLVTDMDRSGNFLRLSLSGTNPEKITSILNGVMERHVAVAADIKSRKLEETILALEEQLREVDRALSQAEQELEEFRVRTISLPSEQAAPVAAGLEITRDPVYSRFFSDRLELDQLRRDRQRLQAVREDFEDGSVRIEALEIIPAAAQSTELRRLLDELVEARAQLRALRDRYSDEYPPIQDQLAQIETLETQAIPNVVDGILSELATQAANLEEAVDESANELEEIPVRAIQEGRLERQADAAEELYRNVLGRVEAARLARASAIPDVRILDEATVPTRPSQDQRLPLAAMIFFGCLGAAMVGAIFLDRMDARFRYAADVSRDIGLDILGSIPRIQAGNGRKGVLNAAQALEAFRELRIHIGFAYGSAGPITLVVTSPSEGEGKSLIASNLAVAFSEVGKRTLLLDGDTRRGDAHRLLARERTPGLIDYLRERTGEDIIQATDHPNLDFIGSGSRGVSTPELLASPRMAYFMGTLKRTYDVVIVDSPPLASGGDPLILGSLTGNMAVVIRTGTTERALAQAKLDQLSRLPIRILGAVLNDVSPKDAYHTYYTSYLPSYEPMPEEGDTAGVELLSETGAGPLGEENE